jgi:hypothetical protein
MARFYDCMFFSWFNYVNQFVRINHVNSSVNFYDFLFGCFLKRVFWLSFCMGHSGLNCAFLFKSSVNYELVLLTVLHLLIE